MLSGGGGSGGMCVGLSGWTNGVGELFYKLKKKGTIGRRGKEMNSLPPLKEASLTGDMRKRRPQPNATRGTLFVFLAVVFFYFVMVICACASGHRNTYSSKANKYREKKWCSHMMG